MFQNCPKIKNIDLTGIDTTFSKTFDSMFSYCSVLEDVNISMFYTPNVTSLKFMFYNDPMIKSVSLMNFDTTNVTEMQYMFSGCTSLTSVYMWGLVQNVTNYVDMFYGINTTGTFYYNSSRPLMYQKIIDIIPSKWSAIGI